MYISFSDMFWKKINKINIVDVSWICLHRCQTALAKRIRCKFLANIIRPLSSYMPAQDVH